MSPGAMVYWDWPMVERFKLAIKHAAAQNPDMQSTFMFEGNTFVLGYALYLLEYLEVEVPR